MFCENFDVTEKKMYGYNYSNLRLNDYLSHLVKNKR